MRSKEEVIKWFLGVLHDLQKDNKNIQMYETYFKSLSNDDLIILANKLVNGEMVLPYYCPNLVEPDITMGNLFAVAKRLNVKFFQRVWMIDQETKMKYLTPDKYPVLDLFVRRQAQHVESGKAAAPHSNTVDMLTGQASGPSRTVRITLPEAHNLGALNLQHVMTELMNVRGGNEMAFKEARRAMKQTGSFSLLELQGVGVPTSLETLNSFLVGMHISNNVLPNQH
jgi:hypothetical protein